MSKIKIVDVQSLNGPGFENEYMGNFVETKRDKIQLRKVSHTDEFSLKFPRFFTEISGRKSEENTKQSRAEERFIEEKNEPETFDQIAEVDKYVRGPYQREWRFENFY
jgi:FMN-dependent NADH-azoreductase